MALCFAALTLRYNILTHWIPLSLAGRTCFSSNLSFGSLPYFEVLVISACQPDNLKICLRFLSSVKSERRWQGYCFWQRNVKSFTSCERVTKEASHASCTHPKALREGHGRRWVSLLASATVCSGEGLHTNLECWHLSQKEFQRNVR